MQVYISADIEGVAGIALLHEATKGNAAYAEFREQMSLDVAAACEAAVGVGARRILVKDAHGSGRNIIPDLLPREASVIRGWSGHPYCMLQDLTAEFDAVAMLGYHAAAYRASFYPGARAVDSETVALEADDFFERC